MLSPAHALALVAPQENTEGQLVSEDADVDADTDAIPTSLLNATLKHLLDACSAKDKAVRFRACQAVSKLLNALDEEAEVDDDMWELLQTIMLRRMTDKIPVVRVQAINAVSRLQDPSDLDCPIIKGYLQCMECDSSPGSYKYRKSRPSWVQEGQWRCV